MGFNVSNWKDIIGKVAPVISTALGGPLAGAATKYIASELLGNESATEDEIASYIQSANPEQLAHVKEIDNSFKIKMAEIGIEQNKLTVENTKNARKMATETSLIPHIILTMVFVVGYFALLFSLLFGVIQMAQEVETILTLLLGALSTGIPMILKFWFGGNPNDDKQNERIYNSVPDKVR